MDDTHDHEADGSTPGDGRRQIGILLEDAPTMDVLVHPGGSGTRAMLHDRGHLDWVRRQRATVALMTSVSTGSLVYAAAGLLIRSSTTPSPKLTCTPPRKENL
jgi:putative intracellular protease/amidase